MIQLKSSSLETASDNSPFRAVFTSTEIAVNTTETGFNDYM